MVRVVVVVMEGLVVVMVVVARVDDIDIGCRVVVAVKWEGEYVEVGGTRSRGGEGGGTRSSRGEQNEVG